MESYDNLFLVWKIDFIDFFLNTVSVYFLHSVVQVLQKIKLTLPCLRVAIAAQTHRILLHTVARIECKEV